MKFGKFKIALISTLIVFVGWLISSWSSIKEFLKDIYSLGILKWIISDMPIARWHFILLILLSILTFVLFVILFVIKLRNDAEDILFYESDCFEEYNPIVFKWSNATGGVYDITPLCPIDFTELTQINKPTEEPKGKPSYGLFCITCKRFYKESPDQNIFRCMADYVKLQIEAHQRSNQWETATRRIKKAKKIAKKYNQPLQQTRKIVLAARH